MANYSNLLATIAANIYQNNNNEVTADMVKTAMDAMVACIGNGYLYKGVATPATDPSTPDEKVFYLASEAGTYTNFGGIVVAAGEVAILKGSGSSWNKETIFFLTFDGPNLWKVTIQHGYINASGSVVESEAWNSCQITMTPLRRYRVVQQTKTSPTSGNNVRVFLHDDDTYVQVFAQQTNGEDVFFDCPDDGHTYVLQAVWDLRTALASGAEEIYELRTIEENDQNVREEIRNTNARINRPNLWYMTMAGSFINASGNVAHNSNFNSCQLAISPAHRYRVVQQTKQIDASGNYVRVFRVSGGVYTQVFERQTNGVDVFFECPADGYSYVLQAIWDTRTTTTTGNTEIYDVTAERLQRVGRIRLLSIGNSYARDALSYLPFILEQFGIHVTIGILYKGGCTLAQHYNLISSGGNYEAFDYYDSDAGVWATETSKNADYALGLQKWDAIMMQQQSDASRDYSTYQPYLNQIINLLFGKLTYPVRLWWLLTPAYPTGSTRLGEDTSDEMFAKICTAVQSVMSETAIESFIPCGTATQNARHTSLSSLGDFGGLTYDGTHLQEGVPCLVEAYTAALAVLSALGLAKNGIAGDQLRPTDAWITSKAIPQPHGNVVGVTDENCRIAQLCAIMAVKFPLAITDLTAIINPAAE